jgi:hypothetical protein
MKQTYLLLMATIVSLSCLAQEKSADVDINVNKGDGGSFWGSPWVWVIGAAVFILLLAAILRGGRRSES